MKESQDKGRVGSFPLDLSPETDQGEDIYGFEEGLSGETMELVGELAVTRKCLLEEIGQVIVGQQDALDLILVSLFAGGHCLMTGVPGLA